jgi:hypothetical protein
MADSLEEGHYRKEGYYRTFQSGLPRPVPPSSGPHYSGQYPSVRGLFLLFLLAGPAVFISLRMIGSECFCKPLKCTLLHAPHTIRHNYIPLS